MTKSTTKIDIVFSDVRIRDFRAYWDAVARGDWEAQDHFFALVVKAWPFGLDPAVPGSFSNLTLAQYQQVQRAIRQASRHEITQQEEA